jgi:DNA-binding winged helix-turn-helix (wHTH) protein/tetratricopeptide (TPR) repeat protein
MAVRRFATFELDDEQGELRRQGRRIHLAAQPLKVLALLTSRAGDIVSRDELRRHVWGDDTFVDFDRSLNFLVAAIRAALRDDARSPRFVETIPRRGYRFIAEVREDAITSIGLRGPSTLGPYGQDGHSGAPADHDSAPAYQWIRRWAWTAVVPLLIAQQPLGTLAHTRATALPAARAAFERGLESSGNGTDGQRRGIAALRTATRLDPRFAEAHYALADLYLDLAVKRELPMDAAIAEARAAAERAVALENVAESRQVLGTIYLLSGDWPEARRQIEQAVALEPKWDGGLVSYARLLSAGGDDAGAIRAIDRAETLSPNCDLILFDAGHIYARAAQFDEAIRRYEGAIAFGPPHHLAADEWRRQVELRLLAVNVVRGDWPAARKNAQAILAANDVADDVRARFGEKDPRTAVTTFLQRSAENLVARRIRDRISPTSIATIEALAGDRTAALDWLERAAVERDAELVFNLRNPEFDPLHGEPRYRALVTRITSASTGRSRQS